MDQIPVPQYQNTSAITNNDNVQSCLPKPRSSFALSVKFYIFPLQVEQNWATLQGGEMTIQTTQASEATQAVASLADAAVAASHEMQPGATVTMALNR